MQGKRVNIIDNEIFKKLAVTLQVRIIHGGNTPKQTPQKSGYFNRINS